MAYRPYYLIKNSSAVISSGLARIQRTTRRRSVVDAVQCLGKCVDLIAVAADRKRQKLAAEFIEPRGLHGQEHRSRLDPRAVPVHSYHLLALRLNRNGIDAVLFVL